MKKRVFCLVLVLTLITAFCANAETVKHERIYGVAASDGSTKTVIDSVYLENTDKMNEIVDKTALADIENVSGHETFALSGEQLVWQASGNSIIYQGTGNKALPVTPTITYTLDGAVISAEELQGKSGELTVKVDYVSNDSVPMLAVSAMILDGSIFTDVVCENAALLSDGSKNILVGFAVAGAPESISLPSGFTFTCKCENTALDLMYTFASASPIKAIAYETQDKAEECRELSSLIIDCFNALNAGTEMPDGNKEVIDIFTSLSELRNGGKQLADGSDILKTGISDLTTGLSTLSSNSDALNQGASQLFGAVLGSANTQLAASGLSEKGITIPELNADNYASVLEGVLEQVNPDTALEKAQNAAREAVKAEVMKKEAEIRTGVNNAVEAKVLEGVLAAVQLPMSAEDYSAAVKAGKVAKEQSEQISAAVKAQMETEEIKAQAEAAFGAQVDALIDKNVQSAEVQAQIETVVASAKVAYDSLSSLKGQLDSVNAFVSGLKTYTEGVASAKDGADKLLSGATDLSAGASTLSSGISDGLQAISDKLMPVLSEDIVKALNSLSELYLSLDGSNSYDLIADGMTNDMVVIIRSDMNK